jgi:catechol 2,3-dioxygenase-like lactoylglutathione lyase family enzyme
VDLKLELVLVPVADVDRAKAFYTEKVGFNLDVDTEPAPGFRIVQMTPPGSARSLISKRAGGSRAQIPSAATTARTRTSATRTGTPGSYRRWHKEPGTT